MNTHYPSSLHQQFKYGWRTLKERQSSAVEQERQRAERLRDSKRKFYGSGPQ